MRDARRAAFTGRAGELTVAAQIMLRNVGVLWPYVDVGCDLMTEFGCRVQVKSAHLYQANDEPRYFFPLPKTRRQPNSDRTTKLIVKKPFAEICDFVVFWGIEQNRFWIVPASLCDETVGVELGADLTSKPRFVGSIADMREMRSLGYSYYKIAKHYGLSCQNSVKQLIDSGRDFVDETVVSRMRACEGRWESILDFRNPAFVREAPIAGETIGGIGGQAEGPKE